jgi:hypothetical protein
VSGLGVEAQEGGELEAVGGDPDRWGRWDLLSWFCPVPPGSGGELFSPGPGAVGAAQAGREHGAAAAEAGVGYRAGLTGCG